MSDVKHQTTENLLSLLELGSQAIEKGIDVVAQVPAKDSTAKVNESEVFQFIFNEGIKEGTTKIPSDVVYARYIAWTKNPLPRKAFMRYFRKYFKQKRTNLVRFYELDATGFNLPADYSIFKNKYRNKYKSGRRKPGKVEDEQGKEEKDQEGQETNQT